ncbi:MAG: SurA N-terminal domain-containing protein [Candidatus Aminicenantes bacterium]|nr:SurA N-terminal domain-containing protein [Candidatus Aminicenantes bacterium]
MLKTMRSNLKSLSWTLWLVILAFIGFIFVQWGSGQLETEGLDRDVAAVGRAKISGEEFQKNLVRSLEMYDKQFNRNLNRQAIQQMGIAEQVLQGMVSGHIIGAEARKFGLGVSENELQDAIRSYPAFQRDGAFIGSEEYERLLAYNHITVRDFEDGLQKDLLADKLKELVTATEVIDADTLREQYHKENEKAELETIALRRDDAREVAGVDEAECRQFHKDHPDLFQSAEKRAGEALVLKFADFKKEVKVKDEELFAYYKDNKSMFRIPGKTRVSRIWCDYDEATREEVLKRMEETAGVLTADSFAAKARELSGDEKAKEGGDWGYWGWQKFSPQEKTLIDRLQAGEVSSPVDAGKGFAILLVSEKVDEQQENYDAVKNRIRATLESEKQKQAAAASINQVYDGIRKAGNLKEGAGKLAAKVIDTGLLTQGQPIKAVDEMGYIAQKLFALNENEISSPLEFPEGLAVVRLTRIVRPQNEPFEAVREKVEQEALGAKKQQLQMARARELAVELNRLADEGQIDKRLEKEGLKKESATYQRGNQLAGFPEKPGLDNTIFALEPGFFSAPLDLKIAAVIVRVKSKKTVSDADFNREREGFQRRKLDEAKNRRFSSFLMDRRNDYKIRFNPEIFEKIKEYAISHYR